MFDFDGKPGKPGLMDNEGEKAPSPIKVEEKLTHPERQTEEYPDVPFLGTDHNELIDKDLAIDLKGKAFLLTIRMSELPLEKERTAYGQVGFVRREDKNGNVVLARSEFSFVSSSMSLQGDGYYVRFPDSAKVKEDLTPYALRRSSEETARDDEWESGVDGAWGSVPRPIQPKHCFPLIRDNFELKKGMKIGVAVALPPLDALYSAFSKEYPNIKIEKLNEVYGVRPGRIANVYVGEITYVGESHIEYDNNTFEGCSGAIVFLLSCDQPESVLDIDRGCAVAVHAGAHPRLNRNLGFKLSAL